MPSLVPVRERWLKRWRAAVENDTVGELVATEVDAAKVRTRRTWEPMLGEALTDDRVETWARDGVMHDMGRAMRALVTKSPTSKRGRPRIDLSQWSADRAAAIADLRLAGVRRPRPDQIWDRMNAAYSWPSNRKTQYYDNLRDAKEAGLIAE